MPPISAPRSVSVGPSPEVASNDFTSLLASMMKQEFTPDSQADFTPTPPWSSVPKAIQSAVNKAAKGSVQDLEVLVVLMEVDKHLARQPSLLPMLYGHLEKAPPSKSSSHPANIRAAKLGAAAFEGILETLRWLNNSAFPLDDRSLTMQYLGRSWPAVWKWIDYFYSQIYRLFQKRTQPLTDFEFKTLSAIRTLFVLILPLHQTVAGKALDETPGAFLMIADMWMRVSDTNLALSPEESGVLSFALIDAITRKNDRTQILVEAMGNDCTKVAPLFLKNLRMSVDKGGEWMKLLSPLIFVIMSATHMMPQLGNAFLSQHIVIEVSRVLAHLSGFSLKSLDEQTASLICFSMRGSLMYLSMTTTLTDGFTWVNQAARGGVVKSLLRCIITSRDGSKRRYEDRLRSSFLVVEKEATKLLQRITHFLLYRSVLKTLDHTMNDPQIPVLESKLPRDGEFWGLWLYFKKLLGERQQVKVQFDTIGKYTQRCALLECPNIEKNAPFRICSACQTSSYCSKECQQRDWKSGRHRVYCETLREDRAAGISSPMSVRDSSFLTFNATEDVTTHRSEILKARNLVLSRSHSMEYIIFIDYTLTPFLIVVDTPDSFAPSDQFSFKKIKPDLRLGSTPPEDPHAVVTMSVRVAHGKTEEVCSWSSDSGTNGWHRWALEGIEGAHASKWEGIPIAQESEFEDGTVGLAGRMKIKQGDDGVFDPSMYRVGSPGALAWLGIRA